MEAELLPKTKVSVYALQADKRWLTKSYAFPLFGSATLVLALICLSGKLSPIVVSVSYTLAACTGLLYRMCTYARREWLLYFIDLCFVCSIVMLISLWYCRSNDCSQSWMQAVFIVASGPVPGATFMLQTPLTLHHPEAFESFFLHATPMWICYYRRWVWGVFDVDPMPTFGELVYDGMVEFYLPWAVFYMIFLLLQPWLPDLVAGYETLMDGFIFKSGATRQDRLEEKRGNYCVYEAKVAAFLIGHAILSLLGAAAAAAAFQDYVTQVVWIACVLIGCVVSGYYFYAESAGKEEHPAFLIGFVRMGFACCIIFPIWAVRTGKITL